jgi:hypothetical protein
MTEAGLMIFSADGVPRDDAAAHIIYSAPPTSANRERSRPRRVLSQGSWRGPGRKARHRTHQTSGRPRRHVGHDHLGDAFHKGLATADGKPDDKEAFRWFSEAANRGNVARPAAISASFT